MIGLVTDSTSQLPPELARRYGVEVVPVTVTVDGVDHREGVDLDADDFYARYEAGTPEVVTSQPSPGAFTQAYGRLVERGATEILSVHVSAEMSGTLNAARLAAGTVPVPVRLVDSATASFGVSCCVWEAAESIRAGADLEEAARVAERTAATVRSVFIVQALELARAGGRLDFDQPVDADAIPVLETAGTDFEVIAEVRTVEEAADAMAHRILRGGGPLRVAIGTADRAAAPFWLALEERVTGHELVTEMVRYRVGPSIGAHTGPGSAGAFFWPGT